MKKSAFTAALLAAAVAAALLAGASSARQTASLQGAGSSFVFPLVSQWTSHYDAAHVSYNPVGSGAGIAAISNRSVDFGASDAPLTKDQAAGCKGCVQIPWALSATSVMYKLDNADPHLRISGKVLSNVFLGSIRYWDDAQLKKLNPGKTLPHTKITPIFRSDASGTTFNFTDYLSSSSPAFRSKVGNSTQVSFPVGVGGKGSSGVSAVLAQTNGGIAYADVAYAIKNHFAFFRVQNKAGKYILPGNAAIAAAASTVKKVPASNAISIVNPPKSKKTAYPICTFTYVIIPTQTSNAASVRSFVFWALTKGQTYGPPLRFVPVPKPVLVAAEKTLKKVHS
ncbi:MAG: phosphate transport system substrate-binding protein [Gaiellaceae bacterium]|nr:phosphate transport system substrate-binding protein [Gaiellaceae bacterium]